MHQLNVSRVFVEVATSIFYTFCDAIISFILKQKFVCICNRNKYEGVSNVYCSTFILESQFQSGAKHELQIEYFLNVVVLFITNELF